MKRQLTNEPAERAVLGSLIADPGRLLDLGDDFRPFLFTIPIHQQIAKAMLDLSRHSREITLASLIGRIPEHNDISVEGYLATLMADQADMEVAGDLFEDLTEMRTLRALVNIGGKIAEEAVKDDGISADEKLQAAISILRDEQNYDARESVSLRQAIIDALATSERRRAGKEAVGIPWFMNRLTNIMGPIEKGQLIGILSDSKGGKTSLALQQIKTAALYGQVLFFSIEMNGREIAWRDLAQESRVSEDAIVEGRYTPEEYSRIEQCGGRMANLPINIHYGSGPTVSQMRAKAIQASRRGELSLIVIDHLKLIRPEDYRIRQKIERFEQIMPDLKSMAKDLNVPVLVLMQRLRSCMDRPNPRPRQDDAYGGGATTENLNSMLAIWRRQQWLEQNPPHDKASGQKKEEWEKEVEASKDRAELIALAKRRGRSNQYIDVNFNGPCALFEEPGAVVPPDQEGMGF